MILDDDDDEPQTVDKAAPPPVEPRPLLKQNLSHIKPVSAAHRRNNSSGKLIQKKPKSKQVTLMKITQKEPESKEVL